MYSLFLPNRTTCKYTLVLASDSCQLLSVCYGESVVNVELSSAQQFSKPFLLSTSKKEYEAVQWFFQEVGP